MSGVSGNRDGKVDFDARLCVRDGGFGCSASYALSELSANSYALRGARRVNTLFSRANRLSDYGFLPVKFLASARLSHCSGSGGSIALMYGMSFSSSSENAIVLPSCDWQARSHANDALAEGHCAS